jgi:crotonobetainyl-CoA:carnitine CoA-transferase CaiB-like acyl-CoA transferase
MHERGHAPAWLCAYDWEAHRPDRLGAEELARLEAAFGAFFAAHTRRELYEGALARRILLAPCNDAAEVLRQRQLRERGLFVTVDYPELGASIEHPDFFARVGIGRVGIRRRAPRAGEHNAEVFGALGVTPAELEKLAGEGAI